MYMKKLQEIFFLILGILLVVWAFTEVLGQKAPSTYQEVNMVEEGDTSLLRIGEYQLAVEVADTPAEREQGLSNHVPLAEGHGMFFIFDTPGQYGFWMKEMLFPLDIVWIDENGKVIGVERNILPETYPNQIFMPKSPIKYVLEINSGEALRFGIDIGTSAAF